MVFFYGKKWRIHDEGEVDEEKKEDEEEDEEDENRFYHLVSCWFNTLVCLSMLLRKKINMHAAHLYNIIKFYVFLI